MKKIFIFMLVPFLFVSCGTIKKTIDSSTETKDSIKVGQKQEEKYISLIDTTKTDNSSTTITEVQFYPPDRKKSEEQKPEEQPPILKKDIPNINSIIKNKPIKSIKQTIILKNIKEAGQTTTEQTQLIKTDSLSIKESKINIKEKSTPTKDPKRFRYIFYILVLLVGVSAFLYLRSRKLKIISWIKKAITFLFKA